jgi:DNA-binding IclR family transcriptional regulator
MPTQPPGRTLKTARAVLRVLKHLARAPDGLTTEQVAEVTGKSRATATYLLNSLCFEGFATRDAAEGRYRLIDAQPASGDPMHHLGACAVPVDELRTAVEELYARTGARAYLALSDGDRVVIEETRGRQGLPLVPGLAPTITGEAHALAVGKAFLAHSRAGAAAYRDAHGLTAFTARTITDEQRLDDELAAIRNRGFAVDDEEYAEGWCCIAAPVFDAAGHLCGVLALSTTRTRFTAAARDLIPVVLSVAGAAGGQAHPATAPLEQQPT